MQVKICRLQIHFSRVGAPSTRLNSWFGALQCMDFKAMNDQCQPMTAEAENDTKRNFSASVETKTCRHDVATKWSVLLSQARFRLRPTCWACQWLCLWIYCICSVPSSWNTVCAQSLRLAAEHRNKLRQTHRSDRNQSGESAWWSWPEITREGWKWQREGQRTWAILWQGSNNQDWIEIKSSPGMSCPERFGRPRSGYSGNKALQMHFFSVEIDHGAHSFFRETANPAWGDSIPEDIECDLEATKAPTWRIDAAKEKKGATNLASSDNMNPCLEAGDLKLRSFQASSLQNNSTRFKTVPNQAGRCEEDAESKECHCKTLLLSLLETYAPDKVFIFQRCLMQNERFPFTL